jgi:hypothetical protein
LRMEALTQNHNPIELRSDNIRKSSRLVCASSKCRQKLKVGDVIISIPKRNKVVHYHEACYDALFIEA